MKYVTIMAAKPSKLEQEVQNTVEVLNKNFGTSIKNYVKQLPHSMSDILDLSLERETNSLPVINASLRLRNMYKKFDKVESLLRDIKNQKGYLKMTSKDEVKKNIKNFIKDCENKLLELLEEIKAEKF